jgi:hypothetical protein
MGGKKMNEDLWNERPVPSARLAPEGAEAKVQNALTSARFWEEERETKIPRPALTLVAMMSTVEVKVLLDEEEQTLTTLVALLRAPEIEKEACPPSDERNVALVTVMIIAEIGVTETERVTEIGRRETPEMLTLPKTKRKKFPSRLSPPSPNPMSEREAKTDLSEAAEGETKSGIGKSLRRNRAAAVNRGGQSVLIRLPLTPLPLLTDAMSPRIAEMGRDQGTVGAGIAVRSGETKTVRTKNDTAAAEEIEIEMQKVVATMMTRRYTVTVAGVVVATHTIALLLPLVLLLLLLLS